MDTPRTVLPPASTALETTLDTTFPRAWGVLADQAEPAHTAGHAALLPWVAQQWQLGQFGRYFTDTTVLLAEGLPWLRERGSATAVRRALRWIGYSSVDIEEDGARLHLNPGREVSDADIARMAHVVRASIPLHVSFYRVFYRLDMRMVRWDRGPALDAAMWDNDSGAPVGVGEAGPPVIGSQARFTLRQVTPRNPQPVRAAGLHCNASRARRADAMRLDVWRWDGRLQRGPAAAQSMLSSSAAQLYQRLALLGGFAQVIARSTTPRPAAMPVRQIATLAGRASPRTPPPRGWTGRWDARPWIDSPIRSNTTTLTE